VVNQNSSVNVNSSANATVSSAAATNASSSQNSNLTVVGVVRPLKRKPPSPQIFSRSQQSADDRFSFVQQQQQQQQRSSLQQQMSTAPEPLCELPSHSDNNGSTVGAGSVGRNRLSESFASQRSSATSSVKTTEKQTKGGTGKGRKPKSPARVIANEPAAKKRRLVGRKKAAAKVPDITDSEDDEPKVSVEIEL